MEKPFSMEAPACRANPSGPDSIDFKYPHFPIIKPRNRRKFFPFPNHYISEGRHALTGGFMNELPEISTVKNKIYTIRGVQVMLDSDLAAIYGYTTSRTTKSVS